MHTSIRQIATGANLQTIKSSKSLRQSNSNTIQQIGHKRDISLIGADARAKVAASAGELVLEIASNLLDTNKSLLLNKSRSKAHICVARQCAMYLMHTSFSLTYCEVADFFGRDRTTVSHACKVVEDLRDDEAFDEKITRLENLATAAKKLTIIQSAEGMPNEK